MPPSTQKTSDVTASLVVVANRLPVDRVADDDGNVDWRASPGGLVSALEPVMRRNHGAWIGWHGAPNEALEPFTDNGLTLVPVPLCESEVEEYYEGFSNGTLWPLYHDAVAPPAYHREWWESYVLINQRFADRAVEVADEGATVWIQDYQLQLVPQMLRDKRPDLQIGFFLHIPFPPAELFQRLPWRRQILEGLLGADLVGFQLRGGAQNFLRLVRQHVGHKSHRETIYMPDGRTVTAGAYPIAIDAAELEALARKPETVERARQIREDLGDPEILLLGVDRLDYTKGIRQRIRAVGELMAEGRLEQARTGFIQVATPSRERVEQYRRLRDDIDMLVGRLNGDLGTIGHPPITYLHSSYPKTEMAALYSAADVMIVTPLRDGMNLVAKEYVACRYRNDGALVLSEFAGAAQELTSAYLVNPYDINGLKDRLMQAVEAPPRDISRRMKAMRRQVFENDISHWAGRFLEDLRKLRPPHGKHPRPV
jgi:trehalose 6-phosphate synthase